MFAFWPKIEDVRKVIARQISPRLFFIYYEVRSEPQQIGYDEPRLGSISDAAAILHFSLSPAV